MPPRDAGQPGTGAPSRGRRAAPPRDDDAGAFPGHGGDGYGNGGYGGGFDSDGFGSGGFDGDGFGRRSAGRGRAAGNGAGPADEGGWPGGARGEPARAGAAPRSGGRRAATPAGGAHQAPAPPRSGGRRGTRHAGPAQDDRPAAVPGSPPGGPPHSPPGRSHDKGGSGGKRMRVMAWVSIVVTVVVVAATLAAYTIYLDLEGNISRKNFEDELKNRPPETGALNVLLVGSDTRAGVGNKKYGPTTTEADGERTDTIILLHLSPDRDKATLVSFPRDSMVQIPACTHPKTKHVVPAGLRQINSAFNDGGIVCTIDTLEKLTQIRIDHYVKVDFAGFKGIIDALGGIPICLPKDVNDKEAKFVMPKGKHTVKGEQALAYVRMRKGLGNGSDTDRIKRQQLFLTQVVKQATSADLLTNPGRLLDFLRAATKTVEMDDKLSVPRLAELAGSAQALTATGLKAITVPWEPYVNDTNRVQWKQPQAEQLFTAIRTDTQVTAPTPKPSTQSATPAKPAIKPSQIRVQVLNGTNVAGKATEVANMLTQHGFVVTQVGNAPLENGTAVSKTKVLYAQRATEGPDYAAPLASKVLLYKNAKLSPAAGKVAGTNLAPFTPETTTTPTTPPGESVKRGSPIVQLVIGADWTGVKPASTIPDALKGDVVDAKTNPCQ
ncbi:LCP family protein [Sinosporangium siamense]|uniref:LCP family protein n=1 Tax=Sinosporangium siamense TaxID=1367973 RepID=UPI001EF2DD2F|nr:LCP family protein [Sinosporangium siamense]